MTHSVCGGPSESRPGFNNAVVNTAAGIQALITPLVPIGVAGVIASVLTQRTYQLTTFCAQDPPPDPGLNPADYLALLNPADLNGYLAARDKFWQWWDHVYWYEACQCTSVATPPRPPVSSPGPGSENPGLDPGGNTCGFWNVAANTLAFDANGNIDDEIPLSSGATGNFKYAQLKHFGGTTAGTSAYPVTVTWSWRATSGGPFIASHTFVQTAGIAQLDSLTLNVPIPANASFLHKNQHTDVTTSSTWSSGGPVTAFCTGDLATPCCPPDPSTQWQLNTIIQILANLNIGSGSSPPTSWSDGVRHNALTGSGRLVLAAAAVGVRVEITSIPPGIDVHPGNPNFYFDLGFITPIAIDVPLRGQRLVFNPQSFALPQFADGIAWTLPAGAQINLVELLPVP